MLKIVLCNGKYTFVGIKLLLYNSLRYGHTVCNFGVMQKKLNINKIQAFQKIAKKVNKLTSQICLYI